MKIQVYRNTSSSEIFPCTTKDIKSSDFSKIESLKVLFGLTYKHRFDQTDKYKYSNVPTILGQVITEATVVGSNRKTNVLEYANGYFSETNLYLYSIKINLYTDNAKEDFKVNILPFVSKWFTEQLIKPDNNKLIDMKLIVEWVNNNHIIHILKPK